jgi:extradiol dioxygenase family protein
MLSMKRPDCLFDPAAGLLRAEQFQIAYATNDIERACRCFQEQYGIKEFRRLSGPLKTGGHIHVELAWVGTTMYELITAEGPGAELFSRVLPASGFAIRHHHLGFLIHSEAEWQALMSEIESKGWKMPSKSSNPGFMRSCFVESPELGHFLEYLFPEAAGIEFFEGVPRS